MAGPTSRNKEIMKFNVMDKNFDYMTRNKITNIYEREQGSENNNAIEQCKQKAEPIKVEVSLTLEKENLTV